MAGVGEALGAISLGALFSTCVECFSYFRASQRMEKDCDILLVKLDIEKTRLLVWGNTVGLLDIPTHGRNSILEKADTIELLHRCLNGIESLLTDADQLTKVYGVAKHSTLGGQEIDFVSSNSMVLFRTAWKRFRIRNASVISKPSLLSKTKWGIYKKETFQGFVNDLKDLIDGLYEIAPVPRETLNYTVEADVESLTDLVQLRLFEAATEDSYRAWSAVAGSIIETSEMGTTDRRDVEEQHSDEIPASSSLNGCLSKSYRPTCRLTTKAETLVTDFIHELKTISNDLLTVLTGPCLKLDSTDPCNLSMMGGDCLIQHKPTQFSHAAIYDTRYSLPSRIDNMLNLKEMLTETIEGIGANHSTALWDDIFDDYKLTKVIFPLARTFIYCAPCVCLIQTALLVCNRASSAIHEYFIRPDDRLKSSCCLEQDRTTGLRSIYNAVKYNEAKAESSLDHKIPAGTRYIDMLWLEERLHHLEFEDEHVVIQSQPLREVSRAVIIGESAFLRPITQKMSCSRIPREAEIWQLEIPSNSDEPWKERFFGTFTSRNPALLTESPQVTTNLPGAQTTSMQGSPWRSRASGTSSIGGQSGSQPPFEFTTDENMEVMEDGS
jgi:Prion-inhibition and propagation